MLKKAIILLLTVFCLTTFSYTAYAGSFTQIADTGILNLGEDEKWEKSYNTSHGKFKIRFRKLFFGSDDKKYHLIIWWNDKRIADGYCPKNKYGYEFKVYKDTATDRIFVDLETKNRAVLFGYEPNNQKLEKYVDSKNYWSADTGPTLLIDNDGDLQLKFLGDGSEYCTRYKLFWDNSVNWFGYKDVTKRRPVLSQPVQASSTYSGGSSSYTPVYDEVEYEEVYYEGS